MKDIVVVILMVAGTFFFAMGTLGLWRFPDVFSRAHASTKCDTLGCGLILLSMVVRSGFSLASLKMLLIIGFIWLTNATAAHVIGNTALKQGYSMLKETRTWIYRGRGE